MAERESTLRTLAVAGGVAVFCSLLVSSVVHWLRPIQIAYSSVTQHRAVLVAAGLIQPNDELGDREIGGRFLALEPRLVDLATGRFINADASVVGRYDYRLASQDPGQSEAIDAGADIASLSRRPKTMPVYLVQEGDEVQAVVLPVYGKGMWSTIHGYVTLEDDLRTIARVWFYEHGETPGIGDRIENADWLASWEGKQAYGADGSVTLRVGGSGDVPEASRVDAITGATVTVTALGRIVRYWLGADGYGPFVERLRSEGL